RPQTPLHEGRREGGVMLVTEWFGGDAQHIPCVGHPVRHTRLCALREESTNAALLVFLTPRPAVAYPAGIVSGIRRRRLHGLPVPMVAALGGEHQDWLPGRRGPPRATPEDQATRGPATVAAGAVGPRRDTVGTAIRLPGRVALPKAAARVLRLTAP